MTCCKQNKGNSTVETVADCTKNIYKLLGHVLVRNKKLVTTDQKFSFNIFLNLDCSNILHLNIVCYI